MSSITKYYCDWCGKEMKACNQGKFQTLFSEKEGTTTTEKMFLDKHFKTTIPPAICHVCLKLIRGTVGPVLVAVVIACRGPEEDDL